MKPKILGHPQPNLSEVLKDTFSGLSCEIISNHFKTKDRSTQGHHYSEEVKQFALNICFHLPRYPSKIPASLNIKCKVRTRILRKFLKTSKTSSLNLMEINADCSAVCDGMALKKNIRYNKHIGQYLGFIDLGGNIIRDDEDVESTEGLMVMLVSLKKSWKYPVEYVVINKINAPTSHSLLRRFIWAGSIQSR